MLTSTFVPNGTVPTIPGSNNFTGVNTFSNSTASTSPTTGAVIITGGLGVSGAVYTASTLTVGGNTTADSNLGTISSVGLSQYYVGTFSVTFQGAFTSGQAKTITYTRIGRMVTLSIPTTTAAASNAATINNTGTAIPSSLRPAASTKWAVNGVFDNSGADINSAMQIDTSGIITVYGTAAGGNFTASGTAGWDRALSVTYYV